MPKTEERLMQSRERLEKKQEIYKHYQTQIKNSVKASEDRHDLYATCGIRSKEIQQLR